MATSNKDSGQGFAGIKRSSNLNTPRHIRPGGTQDVEEAVDLKEIDRPAKNWVGLGERQTDGASGYAGNRNVGRGDKGFNWPKDDTKDSTDLVLDGETNTAYDWGRKPAFVGRRVPWQSYAADPGRPSPLDPTDSNPKRPDFGAPSHDAYDISGLGQEEINEGQPGKAPVPGKPDQWA